ncbi:MAG: 2-succinyl-5-enolpyruvyl-6-hydroxy-3-cyclohexene-1-carboxylic-acid synthase [Acidimicrobiia bacterium]
MDPTEALTTRLAGAFADLGLRHAVISPGSRSTPLATAFAVETRITCHLVHDERSAGFFALGISKQSGIPAALICTSGTAAANYLPPVVEANQARIPLVVLTADRPPELRGVGAPQTIDQVGIYGGNVRLFHEVGVPDDVTAAAAPALALRAWTSALDTPHGPVHLNLPLREPLATPSEPAPPTSLRFHRGEVQLPPEDLADLADRLSGRRSLIVAGGQQRPGFAAATAMLAGEAGIPVIADVQCRFPSPSTITNGDLLASGGFLDSQSPDIIVRIGSVPTSRPIWSWMGRTGAEQFAIEDAGWRDPLGTVSRAYRADPAITFADLAGRLAPSPDDWMPVWAAADHGVGEAVALALADEPFPNEPAIARSVWEAAPSGSTLYTGSSMPIRDLDSFAGQPRGDVAVLSNRGANGIDGVLSAAAGASASDSRHVVVLAGDLSALHDATALNEIARFDLPITIVVVNNDGGGIFHFLPQAAELPPDRFEALFGTPHGLSLASIATAFGVEARTVETDEDLRSAVGDERGPLLVELRTDREENVRVHERLREAASAALAAE